jgi:hypothetical protein
MNYFLDQSVRGNVITIAASDYYYSSNRRCDGTADEVEINAAITKLNSESGGGVIRLSPGTFYLSAAIELNDNIILEGAGAKTILEKNCNDYAIECVGTSGTHKEKARVRDLKVTRNASDTNGVSLIYLYYADGVVINNTVIEDSYDEGIYVDYCESLIVTQNTIKKFRTYGIYLNNITNSFLTDNIVDGDSEVIAGVHRGIYVYRNVTNLFITDNVIQNIYSSNGNASYGVYIYGASDVKNKITVDKNKIRNIVMGYDGNNSSYMAGILILSGDNAVISNNYIEDIYHFGEAGGGYIHTAVWVQNGKQNKVLNNLCVDNGNLIDRGACESTTAPMVEGETTPDNTNVDTYERSGTQEYAGTYSWKATGDGGGTMTVRLVDSGSELHGLVAGLTYTLSAYVYVPTGGYTVGNVKLFYDDDQVSASYSSAVSADDTWELLTLEFTVDDDATDVDFGLFVDETGTDSVYWDKIRLLPEGTHNEHDQQYVDNGTGTQESANSWQGAV